MMTWCSHEETVNHHVPMTLQTDVVNIFMKVVGVLFVHIVANKLDAFMSHLDVQKF